MNGNILKGLKKKRELDGKSNENTLITKTHQRYYLLFLRQAADAAADGHRPTVGLDGIYI